jgi:hypothetical protein
MELERMPVSTATVSTGNAQSYMRKLGQHWSHRFTVIFDEDQGCTIQMTNAVCELRAHPDHLDLRLMVDSGEDQGRMESVVEEHLKRFGFREELQFAWNRLAA